MQALQTRERRRGSPTWGPRSLWDRLPTSQSSLHETEKMAKVIKFAGMKPE